MNLQSKLNFTAIDFKTANPSRASVYKVGLVKVVDGVVTKIEEHLVHPISGEHEVGTPIHGIEWAELAKSPDWPTTHKWIKEVANGDVLVAHNVSFDEGVFDAVNEAAGLPHDSQEFFCTLKLSRRVLKLDSYALPDVAEHLNIKHDDDENHEAAADTLTAAKIVIAIAKKQNANNVYDLWPEEKGSTRRLAPAPLSANNKLLSLQNHSVCFTGKLNMTHVDARALAVQESAEVTEGPTKKTTIMVAGADQKLNPSKEYETAKKFISNGQKLRIIDEEEYLRIINHKQGTTSMNASSATPVAKLSAFASSNTWPNLWAFTALALGALALLGCLFHFLSNTWVIVAAIAAIVTGIISFFGRSKPLKLVGVVGAILGVLALVCAIIHINNGADNSSGSTTSRAVVAPAPTVTVTATPTATPTASAAPAIAKPVKIEYQLVGTPVPYNVTYGKERSMQAIANPGAGWTKTETVDAAIPANYRFVAGTVESDTSTTLTCKILVNGVEVSSNTINAPFAIVTCVAPIS